jgi:hypothetical protein
VPGLALNHDPLISASGSSWESIDLILNDFALLKSM